MLNFKYVSSSIDLNGTSHVVKLVLKYTSIPNELVHHQSNEMVVAIPNGHKTIA